MIVQDWGLIPYAQAYAKQMHIVKNVIAGDSDHLILCEHPAVLTLGRMTKAESFLFHRDLIEADGIDIQTVDRGGDVTLHAPGQLIIYPIINLAHYGKDLKKYMIFLENVAVDLLLDFGILAERIEGQRGVFVGGKKIISIGVGLKKWVTYHGIGINISTDLKLFRWIKPCGLNVQMTSMMQLCPSGVLIKDIKQKCVDKFKSHLLSLGKTS